MASFLDASEIIDPNITVQSNRVESKNSKELQLRKFTIQNFLSDFSSRHRLSHASSNENPCHDHSLESFPKWYLVDPDDTDDAIQDVEEDKTISILMIPFNRVRLQVLIYTTKI
ncbi:uncharacterized protein TRIADDRAFT_59224 [Trichoplax adhaerens]|uniref:Uncharacterized protein n=1 Tax=Trichoplax adhaerens TaxID=10228 RepID=B3S575_TRIAD|nr:predicted protein [Trichoplax adhaerens]EDV22088.1 predicted protein [Trichoplax adhaerens]|eukprot:XP_002115243.1 predicted protein [Trichoplax adhaerens]